MVDLVHIWVYCALPSSTPEFCCVSFKSIVPCCRSTVVDHECDTDLLKSFRSTNCDTISWVILLTRTWNEELVNHLSSFWSSCELRSIPCITSSLEEAYCSLESCFILLLVVHACIVDRITVDISGVSNLVTDICWLRSSPRCVGDWVLDDGSSVAIVRVDNCFSVDREDSHDTLSEVL